MFSRRIGLPQYKKSLTKVQPTARNPHTGLDTLITGTITFTASRRLLFLDNFLSVFYTQYYFFSSLDAERHGLIRFSQFTSKQLSTLRTQLCFAFKNYSFTLYHRFCNTALYRWGRQNIWFNSE